MTVACYHSNVECTINNEKTFHCNFSTTRQQSVMPALASDNQAGIARFDNIIVHIRTNDGMFSLHAKDRADRPSLFKLLHLMLLLLMITTASILSPAAKNCVHVMII
jgi:hypothetical protein